MDKDTRKSIELGFGGKKPPEFYTKCKDTKMKRRKHFFELIGFIIIFFLFLYVYYINPMENIKGDFLLATLSTISLIFIAGSLVAIYKNIRTWIDMFHIIKERFDDYENKRKG